MSSSPMEVFQRHSDAVAAGDLEGVMSTYAPDAILADNHRIGRGHDYIRGIYTAVIDIGSGLEPELTVLTAGNLVFVTWRSRRPGVPELIGTGTYIIEDGLITAHTDYNTTPGSGEPVPLEEAPPAG